MGALPPSACLLDDYIGFVPNVRGRAGILTFVPQPKSSNGVDSGTSFGKLFKMFLSSSEPDKDEPKTPQLIEFERKARQ